MEHFENLGLWVRRSMKSLFSINIFKFVSMAMMLSVFFYSSNLLAQKDITKQDLQRYILEFGLDQPIQLNDFWKRVRFYFPPAEYAEFEQFVLDNPTLALPNVQLEEVNSADGLKISQILLKKDGNEVKMQFVNSSAQRVKINSRSLTEDDLRYPSQALKRVTASDIKFNRESEVYKDNLRKKYISLWNEFFLVREKFIKSFEDWPAIPELQKSQWEKLNSSDRIDLGVKIRLLDSAIEYILLKLERGRLEKAGASKCSVDGKNQENSTGECIIEIFGPSNPIIFDLKSVSKPATSKLSSTEEKLNEWIVLETKRFKKQIESNAKEFSSSIWNSGNVEEDKLKNIVSFKNQIENDSIAIYELCSAYFTGEVPSVKMNHVCEVFSAAWGRLEDPIKLLESFSCHKSAQYSPDKDAPNQTEPCVCLNEDGQVNKRVGFGKRCDADNVAKEVSQFCRHAEFDFKNVNGQQFKCNCDNSDNKWKCVSFETNAWSTASLSVPIASVLFGRSVMRKKPPEVDGQCLKGMAGTPPECRCEQSCPEGSLQNPISCECQNKDSGAKCNPPLVGVFPMCSCPSTVSTCAPLQKIYNMNTCQCTDLQQPVTCPNNSPAPGGNLELCPKCRNGSFMTLNGCPNEGGVGHSCPQGGCNGGLPPSVIEEKK